MREMLFYVEWNEFVQVQALSGECRDNEAAWEAGLRRILGDCLVDAMKHAAAKEPSRFLLTAGDPNPRTFGVMVAPEETS